MKMKCKIFTVAALVTLAAAALYGQARSITATKAYVDRQYLAATSAVPSIVTNEVAEFSAWTYNCTVPEIQAALDANPPTMIFTEGQWYIRNLPSVEGCIIAGEGEFHPGEEFSTEEVFSYSYVLRSLGKYIGITATRELIATRNALGLARLSDLTEAGVPASTVTNIARDVVNSVWDAKLGVAWEARMYDGHLYYIAVTNAPGGAQ